MGLTKFYPSYARSLYLYRLHGLITWKFSSLTVLHNTSSAETNTQSFSAMIRKAAKCKESNVLNPSYLPYFFNNSSASLATSPFKGSTLNLLYSKSKPLIADVN